MSLVSGHQRIDARSIALHRAIAEKLRGEPALLQIAKDTIDRWYPGAANSGPYLDEWRRMLDLPLEELSGLIGQESERMTAMRQSSPFTGVLEPAGRWAIYSRFGEHG